MKSQLKVAAGHSFRTLGPIQEAKNILADFSPFYFQLSEPKVVIESLEALAIKYKANADEINLANSFQMVNSVCTNHVKIGLKTSSRADSEID